jgi:vanillate O-demethylase ferredoxin subunit
LPAITGPLVQTLRDLSEPSSSVEDFYCGQIPFCIGIFPSKNQGAEGDQQAASPQRATRMTEPLFPARLIASRYEATDVVSFLFQPLSHELPERIDPGSHIDVHLPNDMMRSYSLSNGPGQMEGYRLTVARDANSKGGSVFMHDSLRVGQVLEISKPRNNFELAEHAPMSVFISGGIGITPFVPMLARLNELNKPWRLHYCVRTRDRAALLGELSALADAGSGELIPNFDEDPAGILDLDATLRSVPYDAHLYCCGPTTMLNAYRSGAEAAGIEPERVHFEYFSSDVKGATEGGFTVVLQKSGDEVVIEPGQSILHALTAHGLNIPYSCEEGICGACETRVLEGMPDHRDMILSDREREEIKTMMICCSGSKSPRLVLDL